MYRKLSNEQITEAKQLHKKGYTKRQLADMYEVSQTTIWDNIFRRHKPKKRKVGDKKIVYSYRKIKGVIMVVQQLRNEGLTSGQVSMQLDMPLIEVNYIYSHYPPK